MYRPVLAALAPVQFLAQAAPADGLQEVRDVPLRDVKQLTTRRGGRANPRHHVGEHEGMPRVRGIRVGEAPGRSPLVQVVGSTAEATAASNGEWLVFTSERSCERLPWETGRAPQGSRQFDACVARWLQ